MQSMASYAEPFSVIFTLSPPPGIPCATGSSASASPGPMRDPEYPRRAVRVQDIGMRLRLFAHPVESGHARGYPQSNGAKRMWIVAHRNASITVAAMPILIICRSSR